jgi:hypothetical protein
VFWCNDESIHQNRGEQMNTLVTVLMLAVGLFVASAGDLFAMRCGNALVLAGDRPYEVLNKCGEPDFIAVDEWTYNFGPNQFVHYLRFDGGRLTQVELGDYGWDEGVRGSIWPYMAGYGLWRYLPRGAMR